MKLRILAPFRSHFRLSLGYALKTGRLSVFSKDYPTFWDNLQKATDGPLASFNGKVRFLHSRDNLGPDTVRYTTIDEDALRYTAQLIELRPTPLLTFDDEGFLRTVEELATRREKGKAAYDILASRVTLFPGSPVVRIFDHNVSLFEAEIEVTEALKTFSPSSLKSDLDTLREFAVFIGEALIEYFYAREVLPLLRSISQLDEEEAGVVDRLFDDEKRSGAEEEGLGRFRYPLANDMPDNAATEVLWVTRSLICEADDADDPEALAQIVRTWLRAVGDPQLTEKVATDPTRHSTLWLNYVFREGFVARDGGTHFRDVWEAMQLCQYYYSAVETLNDQLNRILASVNQEGAHSSHRDLHNSLDDIVRRSELVLASYVEMQKYLKRDKLKAFEQIMDYWKFDAMETAVREKMALCRNRLDSLSDRSAEKGRLYTDLLLMVLSLMTVLDMSITLALFGRSPTDTVYAQDDAYSGFILAQFARWQPHWIIICAFFLVILLGLRFYVFRRKRLLYD